MRTRAPNHSSPVQDMTIVYDSTGCGKRQRSDAKGVTSTPRTPPVEQGSTNLYKLKNQQKANARRPHQSVQHKELGRCKWDKCPAKSKSKEKGVKRGCPKSTFMHCEERTVLTGKVMYLCNNKIGEVSVFCHIKYHK